MGWSFLGLNPCDESKRFFCSLDCQSPALAPCVPWITEFFFGRKTVWAWNWQLTSS